MAHGRCSPAEYSRTVLKKISAAARSTSVLARSRPLPRAPLCWHRGTCVPKPMRDDCSRCGIGVSGWHGPRSRWRADRNTRAGPACKRADRRIPEAARGLCMGAGYRRQSQGGPRSDHHIEAASSTMSPGWSHAIDPAHAFGTLPRSCVPGLLIAREASHGLQYMSSNV